LKVLVLNPPTKDVRFSRDGRCQSEEGTWLDTFPPVYLASIAGAIREKYNVKLIDCMGSKIKFGECMQMIKDYNPDFAVINTSTPTILMDLETAKLIKESTNAKIIMYGEHITARYKHLLENYSQLDYAIIGEPETPILNILKGNHKVDGVATRDWVGKVWQEPNLDQLPFPAYDLLPPYYFPLTGEIWMYVRSGRGCPYNCIYCVESLVSQHKLRYHSPEYMLKQFKWLANELGIKLWMFWDELSTFDKSRMIKICELLIKEGLNKTCKWFCTTRVDHFDEDLAKIMKEAGCKMVAFGIESGDQKVLDKNRKGITIEQIEKAVSAARKYNLRTIGHFIVGLPGSSPSSERKTIDFAKKLKLDFAQFYIATPFPGSQLYEIALENKWIKPIDDWEKVEQGTAVLSYPNFSNEEIQKWKRKAYHEFYFRPSTILRGLSMMSINRIITKLPSYALKFITWMNK